MNNGLKYILFFAVPFLGLLLITCKKYPEDGKFPWQTVNKRLTNHSWYIKELLVNEIDSTYNVYQHQIQPPYANIETWMYYNTRFDFSLKKEEVLNMGNSLYVITDNNISFEFPSYWNLKSNKNQIELVITASNFPWQFFNCKTNIWNIKKLTDKEFIIENTSVLNKLYRVKFQNNL